MKSIGIVGAGLIGRLLALSLHRQGYLVSLFDKDSKAAHNSAAYAAAGLLTPLGEAPDCEPNIVAMGFAALKLWPEILAGLDAPTFFQQAGSLLVSHEQDQGDYQRFERYIHTHYPVSLHPDFQINALDRQQLLTLEPELGRTFKKGLFLPTEGQIGNRELLSALQTQLEKADIAWLTNTKVEQIKPNDDGCCLLSFRQQVENSEHSIKQIQQFDQVIDCRGVGAKDKNIGKHSALLTDLRAVRGEVFRLYAPEVNLSRPVRLMHPRYQLYIAPKADNIYAVGATQIESDDNSPMTVRSALELLSAAYSVHSGFAEANIIEQLSQLRPAFSDNQPHILANKNLIQVNGLYRHGYLIAPVVLAQVLELVNNISRNKSPDTPCQYSEWLPITIEKTSALA